MAGRAPRPAAPRQSRARGGIVGLEPRAGGTAPRSAPRSCPLSPRGGRPGSAAGSTVRTRTCGGSGTRARWGERLPRGAGRVAVSAGAAASPAPRSAQQPRVPSAAAPPASAHRDPLPPGETWAEEDKRWGSGVAGPRPAAGSVGGGPGAGRPPAVTRAPRPLQRLCRGRAGPSDAARSAPPAGSLGEQPPAAPGPRAPPSRASALRPRLAPCVPGPGALRGGVAGGGWQRPLVPPAARGWPGVESGGGGGGGRARQSDVPPTGSRGQAAPACGGGSSLPLRATLAGHRPLVSVAHDPGTPGSGGRRTGLCGHRDAGPGWARRCWRSGVPATWAFPRLRLSCAPSPLGVWCLISAVPVSGGGGIASRGSQHPRAQNGG